MSKKYIYMLFIFFMFVISTSTYFVKYVNVEQVKQVYDSNNLLCKYSISDIKEEKDNYKILVYYPITENKQLNIKITENINSYIEDFKSELTDSSNELIIKFNSYENGIYTSFVFDVTINNLNYHEENKVFTINFNNKENKIVKIDDILKGDSNNLKIISDTIYENLKTRPEVMENVSAPSLRKFLNLDKEKYSCFYFSNNSIIFCFNENEVISKKCGIVYVPVPLENIQ